jgi:hypothetical protein
MKEKAELECFHLVALFEHDLNQYDDSGKLEFIGSKQIQIEKDLNESDFNIWFPRQTIETDMDQNLEVYFRGNLISQATGVKFNPSMAVGNYKYNSVTRKITVKPLPSLQVSVTSLNFGLLDDFKPLILHLAGCMLLLEISRMEPIIQENQASARKKKQTPALQLLKQSREGNKVMPINESSPSKKYLQYFKERGYDLFCYLATEFTKDDKCPKTKYSNLFHFLKYEQLIICTQVEYLKMIEEQMGVKLSKIFPTNFKYDETIHPILTRLKTDFEKGKN